jgi:hypothetical protein
MTKRSHSNGTLRSQCLSRHIRQVLQAWPCKEAKSAGCLHLQQILLMNQMLLPRCFQRTLCRRNVDPKLLLSSKVKGPPQRRARSTKGDAPKKIAACNNKLGSLDLLASFMSLPAEHFVPTAGAGDSWRQETSLHPLLSTGGSQASKASQSSKRKKTT